MHKTIAAGALIAVFSAAPALACTPIHFARGTSSATVTGIAKSSEEPFTCYTLATGRGQTATVQLLNGGKDDTAFNIDGVVDNQDNHTFKTEAKTYTISVYHMFVREADKRFTLQVSVK
jgi:hypothetical protein